jgi:4-amino-4-deoxy-L-arabinose transferase-like glycosyltransferase
MLWIILILVILYLCYFHNLGVVGFVGPDEPRYAWIARDMVETGDWVTPRLYGKPWFEKPVLYYWGAATSFKLFGVSEKTARLPSAICALLATLTVGWLGARLYGAEIGRWVLLLLPTTVGMIGFSHASATDMPFSGMLTVAMVFATVIVGLKREENPPEVLRTPWFTLLAFGFFLGLAVLAKGPAAIILSGSAVLLWAALTKRWRDAFRCLHPVAIAGFCATALPWYILCSRRNPDFFRIFIIEHNFKRFLTPEFQHIQPFWYYIPVLLLAFLPWTLALLTTAWLGIFRYARGQRFSPETLFLICWASFCVVFFSLSKSKLPGYILPAIPAVGLLLARSYVHLNARESKIFRWVQFSGGVLAVIACVVLLPSDRQGGLGLVFVVLGIGVANMILVTRRHKKLAGLKLSALCVVPILLLLLRVNSIATDSFPRDPSGRTLSQEIKAMQIPLDRIYVVNMHRGQQFSMNFYLHYETSDWDPDAPREGYLLVQRKSCEEIVQKPFACSEEQEIPNPSGWFLYEVKRQNVGATASAN